MHGGVKSVRGQDLRDWIEGMRAAGEIVDIKGADREREIGGIIDIAMRKMGRPAVLFEEVPGYDPEFRVLANLFTSVRRIALTLGLPLDYERKVDIVTGVLPPPDFANFWNQAVINHRDLSSCFPSSVLSIFCFRNSFIIFFTNNLIFR